MRLVKSGLLAAMAVSLPLTAQAVTVTTTDGDVLDGVANGSIRTDLDNVFDGDTSTFFSLGAGEFLSIDVSPLRLESPASLIEVTFNSPNANFPEAATVAFDGVLAGEIFNTGTFTTEPGFSFSSSTSSNGASFTLSFTGGPFSVLTITDTTLDNFAATYAGRTSDGFDIAEISVSAVPLPASLALFLAALTGLGFMARRRRRAA